MFACWNAMLGLNFSCFRKEIHLHEHLNKSQSGEFVNRTARSWTAAHIFKIRMGYFEAESNDHLLKHFVRHHRFDASDTFPTAIRLWPKTDIDALRQKMAGATQRRDNTFKGVIHLLQIKYWFVKRLFASVDSKIVNSYKSIFDKNI